MLGKNAAIAIYHEPDLLESVDFSRIAISNQLSEQKKGEMGQFMTPAAVARFMASLFVEKDIDKIFLLDPGAGIGSLTSAFVEELCTRTKKPKEITVKTFEVDDLLFEQLEKTLYACKQYARQHQIRLDYEIIKKDFIKDSTEFLKSQLFNQQENPTYTHVIMNPPYRKIRSDSEHRKFLQSVDIETGNLYTAFLALAVKLLKPEGELVAITPRSFCNGPYFRSFRNLFFEEMRFRHIHIFESRDSLFSDEEVLQENIIFHAVKTALGESVTITSSYGPEIEHGSERKTAHETIVNPRDRQAIIHIPTNEFDQYVLERIHCFESTLADLGVEVSTGRVVDFRAQEFLSQKQEERTCPLIYPIHFKNGIVQWPLEGAKKPQAIVECSETLPLLMPKGYYVVVRRFSSKEESRRIVAALYDPAKTHSEQVAFENHLNVFHRNNQGLSEKLAKGLAVYLSSTLIDIYFRHFNGHTQVNAADLRMLPYPNLEQLEKLSRLFDGKQPTQESIDSMIEEEVLTMANISSPDPVKAKRKIEEAIHILKELGFPSSQQNERSGLTLLALLNLKPKDKWSAAQAKLIGITPIMDFCKEHYGRIYAPNTRETFRRFTMHQFVMAGLVIENPDQPDRPINSPKWCYQIESGALELIKTYKSKQWKQSLETYLANIITLRKRYEKERKMNMIPVVCAEGKSILLTPGKHNELIKQIIQEFAPRYAPGGQVIYVGDTGQKWAYFDEKAFSKFGVKVDVHGKMPDVVLYLPKKDWLLLIEAVTSHGPVDSKRREELAKLFHKVKDKIIYVTAFPNKSVMNRYLSEISWETEVWIADSPTHLIHFNGNRFLGPYDSIT
jgi:adenine-specific DNA-methyltransferase